MTILQNILYTTIPFLKINIILTTVTYVNYILILLIFIALVFTFHAKGTTVHKVLGLLLVSIFVVFLWILQTQFLFIYLVYILAFISAVLMLFLSVVLMLPISTFTHSSFSVKIKKNSFIGYFLLSIDTNFFTKYIFFVFIILGIIYTLIHYYTEVKANLVPSQIYSIIRKKRLRLKKKIALLFTHICTLFWSYLKPIRIFIVQMTGFFNEGKISINKDHIFSFSYWTLIIKYNFKLTILTLYKLKKPFLETILQLFLYINVLLTVIISLFIKQTWFTEMIDTSFELSQGLGQLKTYLYGDYSLFLIFSTVVLLVSLFGDAVMTRSTK